MSKSELTLVHFWEVLGQKDRRLLHDLLRSTGLRSNLNRGLLPFIPVDEVIALLRSRPYSPWTMSLVMELYHQKDGFNRSLDSKVQTSKRWDREDYDRIIKILSHKPSKLAEQLLEWQAKEGNNA